MTFDAGGVSSSVFIIKIGGSFSAAATSNMVLANGAQAKNIFWLVGGAVGFATRAHAVGTIISVGALSLGDGATINGRTLSFSALNLYNNVLSGTVSAAAQAVIDAAEAAAAQAVIDAANTAAAAQAGIDAANAAAAQAVIDAANAAAAQAVIDAANAAAAQAAVNAANAAAAQAAAAQAAADQALTVLSSPSGAVTKIISNVDGGIISVSLLDALGVVIPVSLVIPSNASTEDLSFSITSPVSPVDMKPGFITIKIIAKNSFNIEVKKFTEPLQINLGKVDSKAGIASSSDGYSWSTIKELTEKSLGANDQDGYYLNNKGEVIILTRHLTSFGTKSKMQDLAITTSEKTLSVGEAFYLDVTGLKGSGHVWFNSLTTHICDVTSSGRVISYKTGNCYLTVSVAASGDYMDTVSASTLFIIEPAVRLTQLVVTKVGTIYFTRNTSALDHKAYLALAKVLNTLSKQKKFTLKVIGYTDASLGLDSSVLSLNRAKTVAAYLRKNLGTLKISASGAGMSQPVAIGRTADQLNRRVEIWISTTK